MPDFNQMGGTPDGYAGLLSAARNGLVRMPDGSYQPAPQFGAPTSVDEIYKGIFSPQTESARDPVGPGTDWNSLIGLRDDPIYSGIPDPSTYGQPPTSVAQTRSEQTRPKPLNAGGAAGGSQALAAIDSLVGIPQASGTINGNKDQSRLDTPLLAFNGDQGANVPLPRIRPNPTANVPLPRIRPLVPPAPGSSPVSITVRGGATGGGAGDSYTVRKGDTLSGISRKSGVPVAVLAAVNSIANPNKIYAGQKLSFGSMVAPSPMPSPSFPRTALAPDNFLSGDPGTVDWSIANQGMQGLAGALNATTLASGGGGGNGGTGGGTIYSNPTKYGATSADRQASAAARANLLAQFGG